MNEFLDFHFAITTFMYPLVNLVAFVAFVVGFVRTPLKRPFMILSLATAMFLVSQVLTLLYFLQRSFDLEMLSSATIRMLFPIQACAEYLGFCLDIVGVVTLVVAIQRLFPRVGKS